MTERQRKFLEVLATDIERHTGLDSLSVFNQAYPDAPYKSRRDAGASRTLMSLERLGYVNGRYPMYSIGHGDRLYWTITESGRKALADAALQT